MDFPRKQIKANARAALSANYWPVVGILFLGSILASIISTVAYVPSYVATITAAMNGYYTDAATAANGASTVVSILGILVAVVFEVGIAWFAYSVYRGETPDVGNLFIAFKDGRLGRVLGGMLLVTLYTILWSLLFIIPGIVKAYQYAMMPYLLIDRPDLSIKECFAMSKEMTSGHKWHLFVLDLSFIGWALLAALTLGILDIFYVAPYLTLAQAGAYDYLKRTRMPQQAQEGPVFQSASYEADYTKETETNNTADTWAETDTDNSDIFDE